MSTDELHDGALDRFTPDACLDGPRGCQGVVQAYPAVSGSGLRYPRCAGHQDRHTARLEPIMRDINTRYPVHPPADFDPHFAGERWDEDDWG